MVYGKLHIMVVYTLPSLFPLCHTDHDGGVVKKEGSQSNFLSSPSPTHLSELFPCSQALCTIYFSNKT